MNQERLLSVLLAPHISEKSSILADEKKKITFKVRLDANKREVKAAVESFLGAKVDSVNMIKVKGEIRRTKKGASKSGDWKKAVVSLAEGSDIDFSSIE